MPDNNIKLLSTAFILACEHLANEYGDDEHEGSKRFAKSKILDAAEKLGISDDEVIKLQCELGITD